MSELSEMWLIPLLVSMSSDAVGRTWERYKSRHADWAAEVLPAAARVAGGTFSEQDIDSWLRQPATLGRLSSCDPSELERAAFSLRDSIAGSPVVTPEVATVDAHRVVEAVALEVLESAPDDRLRMLARIARDVARIDRRSEMVEQLGRAVADGQEIQDQDLRRLVELVEGIHDQMLPSHWRDDATLGEIRALSSTELSGEIGAMLTELPSGVQEILFHTVGRGVTFSIHGEEDREALRSALVADLIRLEDTHLDSERIVKLNASRPEIRWLIAALGEARDRMTRSKFEVDEFSPSSISDRRTWTRLGWLDRLAGPEAGFQTQRVLSHLRAALGRFGVDGSTAIAASGVYLWDAHGSDHYLRPRLPEEVALSDLGDIERVRLVPLAIVPVMRPEGPCVLLKQHRDPTGWGLVLPSCEVGRNAPVDEMVLSIGSAIRVQAGIDDFNEPQYVGLAVSCKRSPTEGIPTAYVFPLYLLSGVTLDRSSWDGLGGTSFSLVAIQELEDIARAGHPNADVYRIIDRLFPAGGSRLWDPQRSFGGTGSSVD